MQDRPKILNAAVLPDTTVAELGRLFDRLDLPKDPEAARAFLQARGKGVRGVALRKTRIDAAFLDLIPDVEIISSYSAGLDNVDVAEVAARGIALKNTSHILAEDVANTALGLALAVTRDLTGADRYVRGGRWPEGGHYPLGRSVSHMRVGIVALGSIGAAVARRLAALGSEVVYYGPRRKPVALPYYDDLVRMAADCDMLILTCPLSEATHHLVDGRVLRALGPRGYLVNIARGPVVDEAALIDVLAGPGLAGAALDVFEHEPEVPQALRDDPRLVLTPHIGSATEETRQGMADFVVDSLAAHFDLNAPERKARMARPASAAAG
ncbi:2-hydroxyacid dehydrogenase [Acidimangrovimonas sediminis]|uniref:2-hydroxyacid dehydrogenase n=1 Tax=Acidimangrovimonas sediminis TaxID=2056283 RepID=UPI000C80CA2F|nr:2-hydroxyacid dehydrogenase [Acidimangrovimonas sediminis]